MGASFLRGGLVQPNFQTGLHAREHSPLPMDTIVGQPNPTSRPTTTNAYGLQSNGFYFPKSSRSTHLPSQSQLHSIHSPNSTSRLPQTCLTRSKPLPTHRNLTKWKGLPDHEALWGTPRSYQAPVSNLSP